jgi:hypothetical protein
MFPSAVAARLLAPYEIFFFFFLHLLSISLYYLFLPFLLAFPLVSCLIHE